MAAPSLVLDLANDIDDKAVHRCQARVYDWS
jgi:hypothetical protein